MIYHVKLMTFIFTD